MLSKILFSVLLCGAALGSCFAQAPDSVAGAFYSDSKRGEAPGSEFAAKVILHADGTYTSLLSSFPSGPYKYSKTAENRGTLMLNTNTYYLTFSGPNQGTVASNSFAPGVGGNFTLGTLSDVNQLTAVSNRTSCASTKASFTGFIIGGTIPRTVLIRGAGPSLPSDSVPGKCLDPRIAVYDGSGTLLISNDDWAVDVAIPENVFVPSSSFQELFQYLGLMPFTAGSKDAAVLVTLEPGAYTVQTYAAAGKDGEVVTEVYLLP